MAKGSLVQARIDPALKKQAEELYASMGTSLSEAIRIFANQSVLEQQMPFTPVSHRKKGQGKAFGILSIFASPTKRERERDAWIASLRIGADTGMQK